MASLNRGPWYVTGAAGVVAALLGAFGAGCEEPAPGPAASAAPKDDPCAKVCPVHAKCVLDLREDLIRTVLDGSGDDVKKTALGYAKQDAKELDDRCRKECKASPDAEKKIGGCTQTACLDLLGCMAKALPEDANAEAGPHSCVVEAQSMCIEYTGPKLKTSDVKPACRALFEGKYEKAACAKADLVASCEVGKGQASERTSYYYSTGKKPNSAESAKAACVGDFKPAAAGDAGAPDAGPSATASAAAAAPTTTPTVGLSDKK